MSCMNSLLPAMWLTCEKSKSSSGAEVACRLCGMVPESVLLILASCTPLAQLTKCLSRLNNALTQERGALKILFYELIHKHKLIKNIFCNVLLVSQEYVYYVTL